MAQPGLPLAELPAHPRSSLPYLEGAAGVVPSGPFTGELSPRVAERIQPMLSLSAPPSLEALALLSGIPAPARLNVWQVPTENRFWVEGARADGTWLTELKFSPEGLNIVHDFPESPGRASLGWSDGLAALDTEGSFRGRPVRESFRPHQAQRLNAEDGGGVLRSYLPQTLALERALLGRNPTPSEWQRLVGAPDGAWVRLQAGDAETPYGLRIVVEHPLYHSQKRWLTASPSLAMKHDVWELQPGTPRGTGTRQFAAAVLGALEHNRTVAPDRRISHLSLQAAQFPPRWVGAQVWPKLGFNGELSLFTQRLLGHEGLPVVSTLFELLATPDGRAFWERNAQDMAMTFSLEPNSLSLQVLEAYLRASGHQDLAGRLRNAQS